MSIWWKKVQDKAAFLLQLKTSTSMQSTDEVRLCFELVRYEKKTEKRIPGFVIFYGNAGEGKFTEIAKGNNIDDSYYSAKWLCSKPRTDFNVDIIGIDNEEYKI